MTRVFARHELKQAVLEVLEEIGPANGYALMQALGDRVGSAWRASPGSVYPALLALEELGLVVGNDDGGGRVYELADEGRIAVARHRGTLERVAVRASSQPTLQTLGTLLDRFAAHHPQRRELLDNKQSQVVEDVLSQATRDIADMITTTRGTG